MKLRVGGEHLLLGNTVFQLRLHNTLGNTGKVYLPLLFIYTTLGFLFVFM